VTPEEYALQQAFISAAAARYSQQFGNYFSQPALSFAEWIQLLQLIYPVVEQLRNESATLARRFYDSQREQNHPELPRNDRPLEGTAFKEFVENMEPARKKMSKAESGQDAQGVFALRIIREVENAGRQQIIHAVENDPEPRILRGWARVATGRETCAWCLMLISRGPTYLGSDNAGLQGLDEDDAQELFDNNDIETYFENIEPHMQQWHTGCDCKVIPVFRQENWFGQEAADRALDLWNEATKEAIRLEDEGLVHKSGRKKGEPFTRNELAINALRRRLERGEINASEFAALAA
jgi:hypothetical protein